MAMPGLIYQKLRGEYPKRRPARTYETQVKETEQGIQQQLVQRDSLHFLSEDEKVLVQISPHLLAVSHFVPYPGWNGYRPIIEQALAAYQEVASPNGIARVGLRYINRVVFDSERVDLEEYFEFYPFVGKRLPDDFNSFMVGIEVARSDARDFLRLQMTTGSPEVPGTVPIIIDLDFYLGQPGKVEVGEEVDWLEQAHSQLEAAFEGCLRDTARERFGEVKE